MLRKADTAEVSRIICFTLRHTWMLSYSPYLPLYTVNVADEITALQLLKLCVTSCATESALPAVAGWCKKKLAVVLHMIPESCWESNSGTCVSLWNGNLSVSDILFLLNWVNWKVLEICQVIRNWEIETGLLEACGVEERTSLGEITEGGLAGPLSAFAMDSCMTGRNTTSPSCGVRWVQESGETPSYSGIHSGLLTRFCWGQQK